MQGLSVCGRQNGNRKFPKLTPKYARGTLQKSLMKYHLSVYSVGGLITSFFVDLPLGFVLNPGTIFLFFCIISRDGCKLGPVSWLSWNGSFLLYFYKVVTGGVSI